MTLAGIDHHTALPPHAREGLAHVRSSVARASGPLTGGAGLARAGLSRAKDHLAGLREDVPGVRTSVPRLDVARATREVPDGDAEHDGGTRTAAAPVDRARDLFVRARAQAPSGTELVARARAAVPSGSQARAAIIGAVHHPTALSLVGAVVLLLAPVTSPVAAGVLGGAALGLVPAGRHLRFPVLVRTSLSLGGVLAIVAGQALDFFGAGPLAWTPVLVAAAMVIASWAVQGRQPSQMRLPLAVMALVALLPVVGLGRSLEVTTVVFGLLLMVVGSPRPQQHGPAVSPVRAQSVRGGARPL